METDRVGSSAVGPPHESPVRRSTSAHDHHDGGPMTVLPPLSVYAGGTGVASTVASTVGWVVVGTGLVDDAGGSRGERHGRAGAGLGHYDRGHDDEDHEQDDAGDRQDPRTRRAEHRLRPDHPVSRHLHAVTGVNLGSGAARWRQESAWPREHTRCEPPGSGATTEGQIRICPTPCAAENVLGLDCLGPWMTPPPLNRQAALTVALRRSVRVRRLAG